MAGLEKIIKVLKQAPKVVDEVPSLLTILGRAGVPAEAAKITKPLGKDAALEAVRKIAERSKKADDFTTGYRARETGEGWQPLSRYLDLEIERGNTPFTGYQKYLDGDYEVSWVARTPKDAERYAVSAGELDDLLTGRITLPPDTVRAVDLQGALRVADDEEGGYLFIRPRKKAAKNL